MKILERYKDQNLKTLTDVVMFHMAKKNMKFDDLAMPKYRLVEF